MNNENRHPVELSNEVIDSGRVDGQPVNRFNQQLTEIDDGIAVVESFSHCWIQKTEEGLVCIDASGPQAGTAVVESIRRWSTDPMHTLIYTHGH
ncbi:MAG: MBL fold metallo-hydrolase, partial [Actinomycetota bacterium]|nr:MBL fold metallo-hydrolase [Actinomycetota bacterium]